MTRAIDAARAVADAVLYEGYVLYPYRASAPKNQVRWQWGVLMPPDAVAQDESERGWCRTAVVIDGDPREVRAGVRFLHVQQRSVENDDGVAVERLDAGDTVYVPWDEAVEEERLLDIPLDEPATFDLVVGGDSSVEDVNGGTLVRTRTPLTLRVTTTVERPVSPYAVTLLTLRVENRTDPPDAPATNRPQWLRRALVACHVLMEVDGASFVSLLDPPQWAKGFVASCDNDGVFPVLAGPDDQSSVVLSSPIILYDHAQLAPQSETTFFDALEIDELLSLRTMTLSEEEKREVRGTDPRAAALLDEVDHMPDELWERLHGTVSYLDTMTSAGPLAPPPEPSAPLDVPWWDPGADGSVDPEHDAVTIAGVPVRRGTRVVLRPGARQADVHDLFLAGHTATVAAVLHDVDGKDHLAVTVDDDPGSDIKLAHGRYLYFAPDEVEPLVTSS
jgi:hypothetical protein